MKKSIPLVIGNWKLNPATEAEAIVLAAGVARGHKNATAPYVGIAPTTLHARVVGKKLARSSVLLGAQAVSAYTVGAHTGEQSVRQLVDAGVQFVIIGHSERRAGGVTDEHVRDTLQAALAGKLLPIVCVGETVRDQAGAFLDTVTAQITSFAKDLTPTQLKKVVIAYEPIWAIGTGQTATAEDVSEMRLCIEQALTTLHDRKTARAVRVLYGGSVKPHNAAVLHQVGGMGGFLVGGASLTAEDFIAITKAVT